jgi:HD-GYP domain-containing protein (c-di-GMP phosphodiesterase class II)
MAADQRVPLGDVRDLVAIGEALPFRVLDAQARLLLSQGQVVSGDAQLQALLERGAWVEYDAVQRVRQERGADKAALPASTAHRPSSLFDRWEQQVWELDALLRKVAKHQPAAPELEAFGTAFVALVERDVDVALFMAVRQDERRFALYALTHGLHAATLVVLTARQLGWDEAKVQRIARAALTMNVSLLELQATMAEQRDPPSKRQMDQIRSHPERSAHMLRDAGVADTAWLDLVRDHHEQTGGGGYPRGLADVPDDVRVLRAADVFTSKITARALRPALVPQQAARDLFQHEAGSPLAGALIKSVGIHPPGELVQLRSGEVAIVTRRAAKGPAPKVACISNRNGQPIIDTVFRDSAEPEFAITGPCTDRARFPKVPPERVYGLVTV